MIAVQGKVTAKRPYPVDWEEGKCRCAGKVPEDRRIDVIERVFDEKRQKWRWKTLVRFHQDCPTHGCNPRNETCQED